MLHRFRAFWFGLFQRGDLKKFFASLTHVRPGRGGYTKLDRYRDFHATFGNESGRKVLAQIIDHCEGAPVLESDVADTHKTAYRAGQREPGLWIVRVLNAEPLEPTRTQ